jgi:hypothetical protein
VLAKARRALVVYGAGHLQRKQQATNYQMDNPLADLGAPSTRTTIPVSSTVCDDPGYFETRLQRLALAGTPQSVADRLKQLCTK